ncbi:hypothetical protein H4R34_004682, partial [Dimargaris verticillata]
MSRQPAPYRTGSKAVEIKCKCQDETRRLFPPFELDYVRLCQFLHQEFRSRLSPDLKNLMVRYVDDEGDLVTMKGNQDLERALRFGHLLRLNIYDRHRCPPSRAEEDVFNQALDNMKHLQLNDLALDTLRGYLTLTRQKIDLLIDELPRASKVSETQDHPSVPRVPAQPRSSKHPSDTQVVLPPADIGDFFETPAPSRRETGTTATYATQPHLGVPNTEYLGNRRSASYTHHSYAEKGYALQPPPERYHEQRNSQYPVAEHGLPAKPSPPNPARVSSHEASEMATEYHFQNSTAATSPHQRTPSVSGVPPPVDAYHQQRLHHGSNPHQQHQPTPSGGYPGVDPAYAKFNARRTSGEGPSYTSGRPSADDTGGNDKALQGERRQAPQISSSYQASTSDNNTGYGPRPLEEVKLADATQQPTSAFTNTSMHFSNRGDESSAPTTSHLPSRTTELDGRLSGGNEHSTSATASRDKKAPPPPPQRPNAEATTSPAAKTKASAGGTTTSGSGANEGQNFRASTSRPSATGSNAVPVGAQPPHPPPPPPTHMNNTAGGNNHHMQQPQYSLPPPHLSASHHPTSPGGSQPPLPPQPMGPVFNAPY